ncbi:MAG: hypothetical protein F4072_13425 [Acidimicrobiaceae bacterium]|nr:hypothetical protein [Acidimicrobiaceae bacterium]
MPVAPAVGRVAEVYDAAGVAPVHEAAEVAPEPSDAVGHDLHLIAGENGHTTGDIANEEAL